MPRTAQGFVHWIEAGAGARWLRVGAFAVVALALTAVVAWKQFHGPTSEATLLAADEGRQLALGGGFTTLVNYPQTAAVLQARGRGFDPEKPYPELHHAPLYSLVIGAALKVLPPKARTAMLAWVPPPPDGFGGDYFLLGLNLLFLWIGAWQVHALGRRLFSGRAARVGCLAYLVSVTLWQRAVSVDGTMLLAVLALAAFQVWERIEAKVEAGEGFPAASLGLLGVVTGLLFLGQYSAGALAVAAAAYAGWRFRGTARWAGATLVLGGALMVATPWLVRNIRVAGNPLGLAANDIALKAGDATAEPAVWRATFTVDAPRLNLTKLSNKVLRTVQDTLRTKLWSGGALVLTAFFVVGMLYRFQRPEVDRLRWWCVLTLGWTVLVQGVCGTGETERQAIVYLSPLVIVFGAGFFEVLLESSALVAQWPRATVAGLLIVQALPLVHDALEPRRIHFDYPPYFPALFVGLGQELQRRSPDGTYGMMADVPAGVAWYAHQRAWAQPVQMKDFYAVTVVQPMAELLLTPTTLDRPLFKSHGPGPAPLATEVARFGDWGQVYRGLFTGTVPVGFPLSQARKVADDLYVLVNPSVVARK